MLQLITILNRCHRFPGFVYQQAGSSFNSRGFLTSSKQTTASTDYSFPTYAYYLNGALSGVTYPSGRQVSNALDSAARVTGVTSTVSGVVTNYVSNVQYTPFNAIQQITLGNSLVENRNYSSDRMQREFSASLHEIHCG